MKPDEIEDIEIDLFVEALRRRHGYDFRHYAKASLRRRVDGLAMALGYTGIAEAIPRLLYDETVLGTVLSGLSVPVTDMFRDPHVFAGIREQVVPLLDTYPRLNIWQAGCATGDEVYSLAILLEEAGLLHKTQIYATDINDVALAKAEEGIFPAAALDGFAGNYQRAGGCRALQDYFSFAYGFAKIRGDLKDHVSFAHHNLVSDGVFCEVHMVLCRNVLIYFDRVLQQRVLGLFADSLIRGGFLCLGTRETVAAFGIGQRFTSVDKALRLFKLTAAAP
jgi:chemotaxis protein methyltransferase CheR